MLKFVIIAGLFVNASNISNMEDIDYFDRPTCEIVLNDGTRTSAEKTCSELLSCIQSATSSGEPTTCG